MADGPDFDSKENLDEISITDIMPTILSTLGVAVPTDVDGKVLPIASDTSGTQSPIELDSDSGNDHGDEVASRLKQLGYME